MLKFEAIAFDVYGTLFDITGQRWGLPEIVETMRRKQLEYSWLVSLMGDYIDFRQLTKSATEYALALHGAEGDVDAILQEQLRIRPYEEVRETLERLGRKHRLAILSNGHPDSLEALLTNAGLRDRFTDVVSVHDTGVFKPAPAVYQRLLDVMRIDREGILFVSSNAWDAFGAARFGLRVAWVNRLRLPAEGVGRRPELEVASLSELVKKVG